MPVGVLSLEVGTFAAAMLTNPYHHNTWLRSVMLTRGWKTYHVAELLGNAYALNTIRKWHSLAKPMPDRARQLIEFKMKAAAEG